MPVVIPFRPSISPYAFDVAIGDALYTIDVHWNAREEAWYFDVSDLSDIVRGLYPIVKGVKIVLGTYLGRRAQHPLFQDGVMLCRVPQGDDVSEPRYDDMGTRVQVWYYTRAELAQELLASAKAA